ncbi:MAG: hypothetical protein B7Y41_11645 [Hydrogenophilales bacterium 28-61-23]|nr:MAG: hypothetical protein B7Y41_11645 [Hydrogenophilales bacterium 28-61-23]
MSESTRCPCESGLAFQACCHPYLSGKAVAHSAEALMRSRYVAYVLEDEPYLLATWHPDTRPAVGSMRFSVDESGVPLSDAGSHFSQQPRPKWLGLSIKRRLLVDENHGVVEFVARYKLNGRAFRIHETSRFERVDGRWFYVDGEVEKS